MRRDKEKTTGQNTVADRSENKGEENRRGEHDMTIHTYKGRGVIKEKGNTHRNRGHLDA